MKNIEVDMGNIAVIKGEDNLVSSGIGSCLIITLYDPKHKISALAHTILYARRLSFEVRSSKDERRKTNPKSPDTKYADMAGQICFPLLSQILAKQMSPAQRRN
jgi:chemotaxis receptor (MCP) glutamine deamidase CheD